MSREEKLKSLEDSCRNILTTLGEDRTRQGLLETPARFARAMLELTAGYTESIPSMVGNAIFHESCKEMIIVRDIEFYSMCEHHMLPFFGHAHVAYIPNGKIIGLSKIPRIVKHIASRLQVQERLTEQVTQALEEIIEPGGVACMIESQHMCMMMRGIQVQSGRMITSSMRGEFLSDVRTRAEFMSLIKSR
jgi:GTP cyclohydrolase I